ncbi:AMP-dependent synthetase/ligase [Prevotella denticola]|jgi:putative long-chain-fatty-acid--coA ligase|uniref:AMP-dependent synthetase/ligase n=1 Tax=Prevotella denticola TaxID=28129 RepID=UPI001BA8989F|nr:long-chain fatty acid--CoA ligase [Prevotella denticola]MBW4713948.1 long-chain fatty acid--CoA ligase [Prevotella denticola]MBW4751891.1 long-chain fatty acid--CoA ligase [Prevotella denticola]MBW4759816.1 long-chain fatty acid--CoA ligase [Prevotella denticola]MBW4898499.1 long-chain fatty acid--CoA ligase [Prevotella denticola]QUB91070.1 long-chain fatty acid--CoA ligase [Prevotella denticola]
MQTNCHLSVLIHEQAKKYGARPVLTFRSFGSLKWKTVSWNQFSMRVKEVSNALLNLGLKPQETIAVFAQNCIQYLYTDFGAYGVRVISIPFYATSSEQQIQYMIQNASVRFLFAGEQEQYDKAHRVAALCPTLERIIVFDPSVRISSHDPNSIYFEDFLKLGEGLPREPEVEERWAAAEEDDICNILYTSGTTGESKGVVLTYRMYRAALEANDRCVPVDEKDRIINFLPFAHVFERGWAYLVLSEGAQMIVNTYPKEIQQSMRETHPTCMSAVPRFWEKVYVAVKERMDNSGAVQRKLFYHALSVGRKRNVQYLSRGKRVPLALEMEYRVVNRTILSLVRKQLGLEHPNIFPTAGAYVSPEVEEFVHSIGLNMIVGYGLTESLATVSCDHLGEPYTIGSVGRPIEGIEIKISDEGEVMLKGPTIMPGYFRRDTTNAEVFDKDGFFHTGDSGYLKDGELFLKERIKDLFKTSNGKYVAPQMVEGMLLVDKFIEQISVIADQRKFVSALIVPEYDVLEEWAKENHIEFNDREELCRNRQVNAMMRERIETLQQRLAPYEQIKRFTLLPHHFSMESGELTNTLKLKRSVVNRHYQDVIDKMYEE